jgi:hypothetical protein
MKRFGWLSRVLADKDDVEELQEKERSRLKRTARQVHRRKQSGSGKSAEIEAIEGPSQTENDAWKFEFSTESGAKHALRFNPETSMWELVDDLLLA